MAVWLPLLDYAVKNSMSVSTLRRYIKRNKVSFKIEHGRYLILEGTEGRESTDRNLAMSASPTLHGRGHEFLGQSGLERDLQIAREEIAELKMLIALYEEKISTGPSHL